MNKKLKLTFVNVGYGEAILAEWPDPDREDGVFTVLIDGGSGMLSEYEDISSGRLPVWEYLELRKIRHLDLMICTHIHEDHVGGLKKVAEILTPRELWQILDPQFFQSMYWIDPLMGENTSQIQFLKALNDYRDLCEFTVGKGGKIWQIFAGDRFRIGHGKQIRILAPSDSCAYAVQKSIHQLYQKEEWDHFSECLTDVDQRMNNCSLILRIDWDGYSYLLPGDTNFLGYQNIPKELLRADFFKLGHHGQIDSISPQLLREIAPKSVICCASSDHRYDSGDKKILEMIQTAGAKLFFSDCPSILGPAISPHLATEFVQAANGMIEGEYCLAELDGSETKGENHGQTI